MKISRESWHYRLQNNFYPLHVEKRSDLCSCMRGFVFAAFLGSVWVGLFGGFLALAAILK